MIQYHTKSGSVYEIDDINLKARVQRPTTSTRATPEWKRILGWKLGAESKILLIQWCPEEVPPLPGSPEGTSRFTHTSPVVKVATDSELE